MILTTNNLFRYEIYVVGTKYFAPEVNWKGWNENEKKVRTG